MSSHAVSGGTHLNQGPAEFKVTVFIFEYRTHMPGGLCKSQDVLLFPWKFMISMRIHVVNQDSLHSSAVYSQSLGSVRVRICLVP